MTLSISAKNLNRDFRRGLIRVDGGFWGRHASSCEFSALYLRGLMKRRLLASERCIRSGSRGRHYTTVELVNRLEAEARSRRQGRLAYILPATSSLSWTNSAIYPSLRPAGNCFSISSVDSASAPQSLSRPMSSRANGRTHATIPG